jgi:hypothetical protein
MRENLTSGLTRGAGASLPLLYLFRLAAGKLHANYGSELKRLLCGRNLFLDGNYLSSNWDRYINYWSNRNIDQLPPTELSKDFPTHGYWDQRSNAFYYYAGTDIFGNVYWLRSLRTMLVFNNQGWLVSKISLDRDKLLFDSILPVVSLLSGEVFYLEHFQMNNQDIVR